MQGCVQRGQRRTCTRRWRTLSVQYFGTVAVDGAVNHADTLELALSAKNVELEFELKPLLELREYWERVVAVQHWMDAESEVLHGRVQPVPDGHVRWCW